MIYISGKKVPLPCKPQLITKHTRRFKRRQILVRADPNIVTNYMQLQEDLQVQDILVLIHSPNITVRRKGATKTEIVIV
jgi:hypothetical protein